jgi:lipid-A-disaccharide synthase
MLIALCAGETSGDQLGAGLIHALRARHPQARFVGIGGPLMAQAGMECWFAADELAVMGLVEVLRHLPRLLKIRRELLKRVKAAGVDCFIGIDAPDFNFAVERKLKQSGIRTIHYVSPSIWAWRQKRAAKIGRSADLVLCLFPFEPELYARHGVRAEFVGHPLAEQFPLEPTPYAARAVLGLPQDAPVLALLPGSREAEVSRLASPFLEAAAALKQRMPRLLVIAPMANARCRELFEAQLLTHHSVQRIEAQAQTVLQAADVVLTASGTAALETALARKPMVVAYKVSGFSAWLARTFKLIKSPWISLPNQLIGAAVVPELLQEQVRTDLLVPALLACFDPAIREQQIGHFAQIHAVLRVDASERAAQFVSALLRPASPPAEGLPT